MGLASNLSLKLKPAVGLLALAGIVGLTELSFGLVSRESDWAKTGAIVIKGLIRKRIQRLRMVLLTKSLGDRYK